MAEAVLSACQDADVLLMAAAVADFRPAHAAQQKLKKDRGLPILALEPTADILASVARQREAVGKPEVVVGFAAETENLMENAQAKVRAKALDLIVANDITAPDAGFAVDTNRVTLIGARGEAEALPLLSKTEVAARVIERVITRLSAKGI
jgi:phosphopantothenoylcysteine decarboxylase/phosphopantothenate--cysteine ligase